MFGRTTLTTTIRRSLDQLVQNHIIENEYLRVVAVLDKLAVLEDAVIPCKGVDAPLGGSENRVDDEAVDTDGGCSDGSELVERTESLG